MPSPYDQIPGVELFMEDGNLRFRPERPPTDSLLILGPALDGPSDKPIAIGNGVDPETVFGTIAFNQHYRGPNDERSGFSGNYLIKACREAQAAGAQDIRLMRVLGTGASGTYTMPAVHNAGASGTILFYARHGGRIYNQVSVAFTSGAVSGKVTLTQPANKNGTITIEWRGSASGSTILDVVDRINSDPRNLTVRAVIGSISSSAAARVLQGSVTLAGGTDGTVYDDLSSSKQPYYEKLRTAQTGTFALLNDYDVDVVLLSGIYLDDAVDGAGGGSDPTASVATIFANWLGKRSIDHTIVGVIGVRPLLNFNDQLAVIEHYNALVNPNSGTRESGWLNAGYFMNNGFLYTDANLDGALDAGARLQVVAIDGMFRDNDLKGYIESAAAVYAGMLTTLPPHQAATRQPIPAIFGLTFQFNREQRNVLVGGIGRDRAAGIEGNSAYVVAFRDEDDGNLIVRDVTAAKRDSDYKDLQILRIAGAVTKAAKSIGKGFLGKGNTTEMRQSFLTKMRSYLDGLADAGALLGKEGVGYTLRLDGGGTILQQVTGTWTLDVTLRPAFQIKKIVVRVRVANE